MKTLRTAVVFAIVMTSLANAVYALQKYYHSPVFQHDDLWYRDASMIPVRKMLADIGPGQVEYLPGPGHDMIKDIGAFFETQYLLTPTLLYRDSPHSPWVLVNFGNGKPAVAMPRLTLVKDFRNGLSLFRRDQ